MTFNNNNTNNNNSTSTGTSTGTSHYHSGSNGFGAPATGFASRGKGAHIKRLSVAPPSQMNSINENDVDNTPAPRTSRSHLLAGLRTQPKTPGAVPASAPYTQTQHQLPLDASRYGRSNMRDAHDMPQTAATASFPGLGMPSGMRPSGGFAQSQYQPPPPPPPPQNGMYEYSEQVLAPPALNFGQEDSNQMDPQMYDELMTANLYLMQRQQQLQEQLRNVTAAANQFQNLGLNGRQQHSAAPNSAMSFYGQQLQNGMQPVVQPVPNQPGLYSVYNPMTGQASFVMDPSFQQGGQLPASPPSSTPGYGNGSPERETAGYFRRDTVSPPSAGVHGRRALTPPKQSPSPPTNVEPLPAPSANAYRPGHRKGMSAGLSRDGPVGSGGPRSAGFPATPMTGTFGPGLGRAGEHPSRQPRGPPAMEELKAAPTAKHEGSKNFATRQRRRAVFNLVRAGNERRGGRSISREAGASGSDGEAVSAGSDSGSDKAMQRSWRVSVGQ